MPQERLPSADEVARTLADILSGPDFDSFEGGLLARLLDELWARFWEWVGRIFPDIPEAPAGLLAVLVVAVCVGAVSFVVLRLLPKAGPEAERRDRDAAPEEPRTAKDWLRIAAERARAAEYRLAATALYQGFVLTLERRGAVVFHPSKTPGEYAMEAAGSGAVDEEESARATTFVRSFQKLAFGRDAPTPSGYHGLEELAGRAGCEVTGGEAAGGK